MTDLELITRVREKDSDALLELFRNYIGIVYNIKNKYYLRDYDDDDWEQDALMTCYEACCLFDVQKGSNFGSYFKTYLSNHACSLLRHDLAQRREPYRHAISYEGLMSIGGVEEQTVEMDAPIDGKILEAYLKSLSHVEIMIFLHHVGYVSQKELNEMGFTKKQVQQAKHRCKKKFLETLD